MTAVGDVYEDRRKPGRRIRITERRDPPRSWSDSEGTWRAEVIAHPNARQHSETTYLSDSTLARQWVQVDTAEDAP